MATLPRKDYAAVYGPTTGDRVRLADSDLFAEIERDYTHYGDELTTGAGKSMRDGRIAPNLGLRAMQQVGHTGRIVDVGSSCGDGMDNPQTAIDADGPLYQRTTDFPSWSGACPDLGACLCSWSMTVH